LITAGAFISIPIPGSPVPIVLQNMFVVLVGVLLSPGWAALTVGVYLVLGAVGLPVFAGATGGIAHFAGPTGGFLIGFPISATLTSWIMRAPGRDPGRSSKRKLAIAIASGFLIVYITGVPWLARVAGLGPSHAMAAGMIPFLPGDALKAIALFAVVRSLPRSVWQFLQ
jgi:biotin transport system substrate-specific component